MSSRERPVVLASRANDDLEDILLSGLAAWGFEATAGYRPCIDEAIELIARFPDIGRPVTIGGVIPNPFGHWLFPATPPR